MKSFISRIGDKIKNNIQNDNSNGNSSSSNGSGSLKSTLSAISRNLSKNDLNEEYDNNTLGMMSDVHRRHNNYHLSDEEPLDHNDLSIGARELVDAALQPFVRTPDGCVVDHLLNLFGIGADTNCYANAAEYNDRLRHPIKYIKFKTFTSACNINDISQWDRQYVDRVVKLVRQLKNYPIGKCTLSAIDKRYNEEGQEMLKQTGTYVPNDYLMDIISDFPELFTPCISIHPYRKDAIDELLKWIVKGVRFVRWLPISMGIDMSSDLCIPFFEALVENDIILFVHTGDEHSLVEPPESNNAYGNPLLLRRALDMGVKIVAVHCGGDGKNTDFDEQKDTELEQNSKPSLIPNLHLFLRLMHEKKYEHNLVGDLSGITAIYRVESLVPLLDHHYLHHRLIFSSDYPTGPAAAVTTLLANRELISPDERNLVNEIYKFNPILFDIVLKRILRSPITGNRFNLSVFKENKFFESNDLSPNIMLNLQSLNNSSNNSNSNSQYSSNLNSPILDLVNLKDDDFELEEYTDF